MEQGLQLCAFTDLLSQLPGLHWWQSLNGSAYAFAPACQALVKSAEPLSPEKWQSLIHPHDRARRSAALPLAPGEEKSLRYRLSIKGENRLWVQENIRSVHTEDAGSVLISTATSYTESPQHLVFNSTSSFQVLLDLEGNIEEINAAAEEFLAQEWSQVWGKPVWEQSCFKWDLNSSRQLREALQQTGETKPEKLSELSLRAKNSNFYGDFLVKPLQGRHEQTDYLLLESATVDKQETGTLRQWQKLTHNIPDLMVRYDRNFHYLFVNPAIEAFTGQKPEHFLGKSAREINFFDQSWGAFESCLHKLLESGQQQDHTGWINLPAQKARRIHSLLIPEKDEQGHVTSILSISRDVSELAEQEKATEQSIAQLRAIIEGTQDLIFAFDHDFRLIAFNQAFKQEVQQIFGIEARLGDSLQELLGNYPAELKNAKDLWHRALQGEEYTILQEFGDPSRARNYYEISFSSIRNEAGQLMGASSRTRKVSHQRQIQKELKDTHEFLILAENLPQIIFTARPNGQIDYLNQAFYQYTRQPYPLAEQVDWKLALHPDDYQSCLQQWLRSVKGNIPGLQLEFRLRSRHGLYRWHLARAVPLFNALNQPVKWVGVISDIHEAKMASERERLSAEEFKTIANSLPHMVWTARADGTISYLNQKWYEYTGEKAVSPLQKGWLDLVHPDDVQRHLKAWQKALETSTDYQVEYRLRHVSGRYRWFLARGIPFTNADGQVLKWFGTCTDIHENKLQRKRLQTQNQRLQQINQYLDNFVHAAAHDLRSPLANMKGLLQLLHTSDSTKSAKVMKSMELSLYRLDNTLQAMIHSIELQSLKQSPAKVLDLATVFNQVHQEFVERLQIVPHEIYTDFKSCPTLTFIPFYLESLFRNLLSNAIKYRKEDQKLVIHISCRPHRNSKLLQFSDNGIGIDVEKYKNKLFKPFQRFTQQATGKGIGLHLINNIVTKTGGKIVVKSEPGQGTTFLMYLKDLEA